MIFRSEAVVRRWWREEARTLDEEHSLVWIEPKAGSTFGVPDLLYALDGRLVPVELKLGSFRDGFLIWNLRPSQAVFGARMFKLGIPTFLCVGVEGSKTLCICRLDDGFSGKTKEWVEIRRLEDAKGFFRHRFQVPFFRTFEDSVEGRGRKEGGEGFGNKPLDPNWNLNNWRKA